jgi:RNA polymerase sigma factor (sigma-70 family)
MSGIGSGRDVSALERAWREHAAELVRYATLLVGPGDASDVVSIAFLRAGDRLEAVEQVRGYMYRAVTTVAFDQRRSARRRQARELAALLPSVVPASSDDTDLRAAIARLSVQQRAVVYFTYWHDHSAEQISDVLGIAPATVRRHLARARDHLRKALS